MKRLIVLAVLALTVLAGAAHSAKANFPGADGRIAYATYSTGEIVTIKPDGTDPRVVAAPSDANHAETEPAWSPNGQLIVFTELDFNGGPNQFWLVNADGTNRHLLFAESAGYGDGQANWSPDGSRLIFRRCSNRRDECSIYTIKADGHGLTQITQPSQNGKNGNADVKPEFSPDGTTVSFSSFNRGGVQNGIYLTKLHGGSIQLITPTALGAVDADWSPDGSKLVFWTQCCGGGPSAIDTINPDGSGLTQLISPPPSGQILRPSYSPQGDTIVFTRFTDQGSDIETIPADGGTPTVAATDADYPSWGTAP